MAIYLLFFFYFCKLLLLFLLFCIISYFDWIVICDNDLKKKLEIFSIVHFDNKKTLYYLRLVSINEKYDDIYAPYEVNTRIIEKIVGHFTPINNS